MLDSSAFRKLSFYDVDHIQKCKVCEYRYLCGGACRAWSGEAAQYQLDAPPVECEGLMSRAKEILAAARLYLSNEKSSEVYEFMNQTLFGDRLISSRNG